MQRKRRRHFSADPWPSPKEYPRRCEWYSRATSFLLSLSVPKHSAQPLGRMSLCPIFTNRKQWKYYNKGELDCQDSAKSNKKSRLCRQERTGKNRIPVSISSIEPGSNVRLSTMYSHEMPAATRRQKSPADISRNEPGRNVRLLTMSSHELPLVHTSEMTLDYSFLSDSRNFFV